MLSNDCSGQIADGQSHIYPDGVREIKGKFKSGAVVRLTDSHGEDIGLGIVNYSSSQLETPEKNKGMKNKAVIDPEAFVCHVDLSLPVY